MIIIHSCVLNIGRISKGRAMLTTAKNDDYFESGTICAGDSKGYRPARWVNTNSSPGRIWYWLNENDCDSDYKKGRDMFIPPSLNTLTFPRFPRKSKNRLNTSLPCFVVLFNIFFFKNCR